MGRELRRKQAKKDGKSLKEDTIKKNENQYNDIYKLLKTFGILLVIILVIHFFTALVITKEIEWFSKDDDVKDTDVTTVDNSILAKNVFMQSEEEYYVYFYNFDDYDSDIMNLINTKLTEDKVYKVNTNDAFNSNYVTEEEIGNSNAISIDELKVINPTLIRISGDVIVEYYEKVDEITNYLESK